MKHVLRYVFHLLKLVVSIPLIPVFVGAFLYMWSMEESWTFRDTWESFTDFYGWPLLRPEVKEE